MPSIEWNLLSVVPVILGLLITGGEQASRAAAVPGEPVRLLEQADSAVMEGLQEEAVRKFEAALAESPTSLEARMGYGRALAALGRCEQAVKVLADVAGTKETRAAAEEVLGVCYFRLHDYVPALTHLEESVRLAPARKDSTIFLSRANAASGRLKDAVRTLKSWLKRNGDDVDVLYWIGKFNEELAELAYQRMVKANPNHYLVFLLQSEQYIWKKDYVRGLEAIDRAIALAPQAPGLHYTRANILWRQRSLEKAREDLEIELKSNPYHAQANFLLGDIHATMREPKSAIPYLERAVALDPRLWDAHRALGRSYIMENRLGEAIQHFQIVADANPTDATIHGLLSNAYRRMGDVEKAVEESRIFQKLSAERRERVPKPTIEEPPELAPQP